jgi:hypothetical protein
MSWLDVVNGWFDFMLDGVLVVLGWCNNVAVDSGDGDDQEDDDRLGLHLSTSVDWSS